jgi:hypothetical protein
VIGPPASGPANVIRREGFQSTETHCQSEIAMNPTPHDQTEHDEPAEEMPDVTMTDSGEKEPGEDPDFDDSELGIDDRT